MKETFPRNLNQHLTINIKKQTLQFFQNNTLYRDVKDNMLEQGSREKCTISVTMVEQVKNITDKKKRICILYIM